jgi:peptidyl-dipeptidase A
VKQDPRTCDYSGSEPAGRFLRDILKLGATHDWRQLMRETTGEDISPRAMLDFYQPVLQDLAKRNQGLDCAR